MEWVKLDTDYYLEIAMLRAGEAAEILWARAKAYAGAEETDGFVPAEMLARLTPARGRARAAALVREGIWDVVPGGWQFVVWKQATREQMTESREAGRKRQARHRDRRKPPVSNAVTNASRHTHVTETEVEVEEETAAAAAAAEVVDGLPVSISILRQRLQSHTALSALRFDQLVPTQINELEHLIDQHGDERLVDVAIRTCRNPPPVSVAAFLGTWASLPPPGQSLGVVRQQTLCDTHGTPVSPSGVCSGCASDQKAAR